MHMWLVPKSRVMAQKRHHRWATDSRTTLKYSNRNIQQLNTERQLETSQQIPTTTARLLSKMQDKYTYAWTAKYLYQVSRYEWLFENYFSYFNQSMLWVLKRPVSMRGFFWAPKTQEKHILWVLKKSTGLQIFFQEWWGPKWLMDGPKWPMEQKMVGHLLKWWAQA